MRRAIGLCAFYHLHYNIVTLTCNCYEKQEFHRIWSPSHWIVGGKSTDLDKFVINIYAIIMVQCIAFCERVSFPQFAAYIRVTEARWHARTRI